MESVIMCLVTYLGACFSPGVPMQIVEYKPVTLVKTFKKHYQIEINEVNCNTMKYEKVKKYINKKKCSEL